MEMANPGKGCKYFNYLPTLKIPLLAYLLFILYLVLFSWLLGKIKFIRDAGLGRKMIIILFLAKVAAGVLNSYINLYHYPDTDAASFHFESMKEYHLLWNDPQAWLTNIFRKYHQNSGLLDITDSFWNNLRSNLMIKFLSLLNIFSGGNFFVNTVMYNFLVFFGHIAFYRIFIQLFPARRNLVIISTFLLPSVIYFSSGIHKDGLIFLALGVCCYNLFFLLRRRFTVKSLLGLAGGLLIIFLLRNFILITLLPAIVAWIIAEKYRRYTLQAFIAVYVFFLLAFFMAGKVHPALDMPQYVSTRQIAFVEIAKGGQSAININPLFPHFRSFLNNSPQALNHSLMRPYMSEKFSFLYVFSAIEILCYELLFFLFLLLGPVARKTDAFICFCIFFSLSMFLMIGYTIPIVGAIVRYRSIYLPFIITPLLCSIDWQKISAILHIKK